jgi:hypothetical protein
VGAFSDYKEPPGGRVELNADGSPRFPKDQPTSSPTATPTATPTSGADIRAAASGAGQKTFGEIMAGLGLPVQDTPNSPGSSATVDKKNPPLLWTPGRKPVTYGPSYSTDPIEKLKTRADAQNEIFRNDAYREKVAKQMIAAGLLDPTQEHDLGAIADAWNKVVGQAVSFYAAGNARTPEQVIALINVQKKASARAASEPYTNVSDATTPQTFDDAPTKIRDVLAQTLGRAPSTEEMRSYQAGLNAAAQANPQQSHQVVNGDGKGNTTVNTTNTGGIDPTEVLGQMAQRDPEYGAYQASTTYMDALRQTIKGW